MNDALIALKDSLHFKTVKARCPVFGICGGCQFQDLTYEDELSLKERYIRSLFSKAGLAKKEMVRPIVVSPLIYHYRSRMDLKLLRIKSGEMFMGFNPMQGYRVVEVQHCPIAMDAIAGFLPELRREAMEKMPLKYRNANLTVKAGSDGRVVWGGIGRRSLRMAPEQYLYADLMGKRIFYSLETFFQANLSILPSLIEVIQGLDCMDSQTAFLDLYGGVGLFGVSLADRAAGVVLIEENVHSIACARHNMEFNGIKNMEILEGRMEDLFGPLLTRMDPRNTVAMIDPPRAGLNSSVAAVLAESKPFKALLYLSCDPHTLITDLRQILQAGTYQIQTVIPFDFFPRTRHLETLVVLTPHSRD